MPKMIPTLNQNASKHFTLIPNVPKYSNLGMIFPRFVKW